MKYLHYILLFFLVSCSVKYSFTGASISPQVKTFSVSYIENLALKKHAPMSDLFTEGLKDKFRSNAGLSLVSANGDLQFSGAIVDYSESYQGVTAGQVAALNRLSIVVTIIFTNTVEKQKSFEKKFSSFRDYDATQNLSNVEDVLVKQMVDEIVEDIFMQAVANW